MNSNLYNTPHLYEHRDIAPKTLTSKYYKNTHSGSFFYPFLYKATKMDLRELLTIIITTSPVKSHPSTELLDGVRESFRFIPGLWQCPQIIIAYDQPETPLVGHLDGRKFLTDKDRQEQIMKKK